MVSIDQNRRLLSLLVVGLLVGAPAEGQEQGDTLAVFFLGNSYIYFNNLHFEEGAHVGIDRDRLGRDHLFLGIELEGNARLERAQWGSGDGGGDDYALVGLTSTGDFTATSQHQAGCSTRCSWKIFGDKLTTKAWWLKGESATERFTVTLESLADIACPDRHT